MSLSESEVYDAGIFLAMPKHSSPLKGEYYQEAVATAMRALEAVVRVRELHTRNEDGEDYCSTCGPAYHTICCGVSAWPCPTIQILDGGGGTT